MPTRARKTSSSVGCFSMYSTVAGGRSCLSSARVPFTMIRPWWRIAIRSASCSASSRYCVVSSTVVPWSASSLTSATPRCGLRVEPRRRLVEEDDRRVPIRLMAMSSRRRIPPEYVATLRPAASVSEKRSSRSSAIVPGSVEVPQLGDEHEVLAAAKDLVDGGELAGQAEGLPDLRRLRGDVEAVDVAVPASALSSVDRMRTTVVLPAPFEPSRAKMLPRSTSKSTPLQDLELLVGLLQALHLDRRCLDLEAVICVCSLGSSDRDVAVGRPRADRRALDVGTGLRGPAQLAADRPWSDRTSRYAAVPVGTPTVTAP